MRCANIVLISFEVKDQNLELIDNVAALETRYSEKKINDKPVNVISVHIGPTEVDVVADKFRHIAGQKLAALQAPQADNGLYLIIHAGPTVSRPEAAALAAQTAEVIGLGVLFRKINLAGCFTGGNKLGNVPGSPLKQYTDMLAKLFHTRRPALGTPWVCAYLTEVTTFDKNSGYFKQLLKERGEVAQDPLQGLTGVHNLVKIGKHIRPTHAPARAEDAQLLQNAMTVLQNKALTAKPVTKLLKDRSIDSLDPADRAQVDMAVHAQIGIVRKSSKEEDGALRGLTPVIENYERYMREKIVVRYNPATGTFQPASLAEYADNLTARLLMTPIPKLVGPDKFVFNL